jgi:hypothetical protein
VVSVTPQKAVLTQGGDAVVVQANGTNLSVINSAQVVRAGTAVSEIEVTLDKSLLPTTLKVSLKALAIAPIATDYQLAVLDAGNTKLFDVPTTILAIEVVAPVQKKTIAQKVATPVKATEPVQRQAQAAPITSIVKPGVTSVTPQKAVLIRGGEAVVVEAKGTNLTGVGSVQVTRAGSEAQGIEETLDRSQLPNTLKVSLKASAETPVANDYQLSVFNANKQKLLDVPTAVLAIEVAAPGTKTFAAPTARKPRQQAPLTRDQMAVSRPDVASISPQKAVLIQGGDPVAVEAKGAKLDMVASARVMRAGAPVSEIEASVDRSQLPTLLKVNLKASSQAQVGTGYQLAVFDTNRRKILDVPSTALAIEVAAPGQASPLTQRPERFARKVSPSSTQPTTPRPTGLPYIAWWTPSPNRSDSEITFRGRDIAADYFAAKVATTELNITYRSPSEVRAKCPSERMKGDLIVGYGTPETEYILQPDYWVKGEPIIQSVSPETFRFGDLVTINGQDLDMTFTCRGVSLDTSSTMGYIKISDQSGSRYGKDFVKISDWQFDADTTTMTFRVYEAYDLDTGGGLLSPQPSALTGKLRLCSKFTSDTYTVTSPNPVTFRGDVNQLVVTKINWSYWPEVTHFIILDQDEKQNVIEVEGKGLIPYKTEAKLGDVELWENFSSHGQDGWIQIPLNSPSGPIVFTRDNLRAESSYLNVFAPPTFTPATLNFLKLQQSSVPCEIVLNTTYRLAGWNLKPSGADGLTYEFSIPPFWPAISPYFQFKVLSHTANLIEFRIDLVGILPQGYESWGEFTGNSSNAILILKAKYGTKEKEFFQKPYILKVQ